MYYSDTVAISWSVDNIIMTPETTKQIFLWNKSDFHQINHIMMQRSSEFLTIYIIHVTPQLKYYGQLSRQSALNVSILYAFFQEPLQSPLDQYLH